MITTTERKETRKKRASIMLRDNGECYICGCNSIAILEVHHIFPLYLGGNSDDDNLITLCDSCHRIVPHELTAFDFQDKDTFKFTFSEFTHLVQSNQRAAVVIKITHEWNKPFGFGWGDLRDLNLTCKRVIEGLRPHKKVIAEEPRWRYSLIDIDAFVSEVIEKNMKGSV